MLGCTVVSGALARRAVLYSISYLKTAQINWRRFYFTSSIWGIRRQTQQQKKKKKKKTFVV